VKAYGTISFGNYSLRFQQSGPSLLLLLVIVIKVLLKLQKFCYPQYYEPTAASTYRKTSSKSMGKAWRDCLGHC